MLTISTPIFADETSVAAGGIGLVARDGNAAAEWFEGAGSEERLLVATPLLCTGADIESVTLRSRTHWSFVGASRREYWLEFTLRPEAVERIGECARRDPDARLALLLRGQVASQILLRGPIAGSRLVWHGIGDKGGAETLVREIEAMIRSARARSVVLAR